MLYFSSQQSYMGKIVFADAFFPIEQGARWVEFEPETSIHPVTKGGYHHWNYLHMLLCPRLIGI